MPPDLFDRHLRSVRRDRAARVGPDLVLFERAFDECLDRLGDLSRSFGRAMLIGCPSPDWPSRLATIAGDVDIFDPGALFADQAGGMAIEEDRHDFGAARYDLCVAVGTLETVNDLPLALRLIGRALRRDAPLIGAIAGGNSLPALRASLIEAGRQQGRIVARTHPRIEPGALAQLLAAAGFNIPVVDVDRVRLRYPSFDALIGDLRSMAANSVLAERPPPMSRPELRRVRAAFEVRASEGRVEETIEILHFLAWTE